MLLAEDSWLIQHSCCKCWRIPFSGLAEEWIHIERKDILTILLHSYLPAREI